ncbi:MAG TPA: hypothetical protein ENG51_16545 [Deltaproteobacteria bacterium]|nr:hypothetical protein [Deltaproteobacteria bacterium]
MDIDLEKDLVVTDEDIEFLRKTRYSGDIGMDEYIDFLQEFWSLERKAKEAKHFQGEFEL